MNRNPDLRVIRTKKFIKEAFYNLLETEGFDNITISKLTAEAMVSRTTFYLHYIDKYELVESLEEEFLKELFSYVGIDKMNINTSFSNPELFAMEFFTEYYRYILDHKREFNLLFNSRSNSTFFYKLKTSYKHHMEMIFNANLEKLEVPAQTNYLFSLVIGAQASITEDWVQNDMKETPEEMAVTLSKIVVHIPGILLENNK